MRLARLLLVSCALPGLAEAGAWPREPGTTFLSFKLTDVRADAAASLYLERGLTQRLTLATSYDGTERLVGETASTLRVALRPDGPVQVTPEIGFGLDLGGFASAEDIQDGADPFDAGAAVIGALNLGAGRETPFGAGWADLRLSVRHRPSGDLPNRREATLTAGIAPGERHLLYAAVTRGTEGDADWTRITPSYAIRVAPWARLVGEAAIEADETRIGIGAWFDF